MVCPSRRLLFVFEITETKKHIYLRTKSFRSLCFSVSLSRGLHATGGSVPLHVTRRYYHVELELDDVNKVDLTTFDRHLVDAFRQERREEGGTTHTIISMFSHTLCNNQP